MKKTTFALVGTGIVGERVINQLRTNESAKIIALLDANNKRLNDMADTYGLYAASSYEEIVEMKPDWIYIGTPPVSHAALSTVAISKGLNVLCEKPLAHDVTDRAVMVSAAENSDFHTAMHFPLIVRPLGI